MLCLHSGVVDLVYLDIFGNLLFFIICIALLPRNPGHGSVPRCARCSINTIKRQIFKSWSKVNGKKFIFSELTQCYSTY